MCTFQVDLKEHVQISSRCFRPLDIGRVIVFDKGRKLYGLALECGVRKGVLRRLSEIAEKVGAVIRFVQYSMTEAEEPLVKGMAFLDFSDSEATPEEALELVRKQKFVREAYLIKPGRKGIIFDDYFFPLVVGCERAVIFRKNVYEALFKGVRENFGSAGEAMLYYQGFYIGAKIYGLYANMAGSENPEDLTEVVKAMLMTLGWAIIDDVEVDVKKGTAKVRILENFECEIGKGYGKPYSQFLRGAIAGMFAKFFRKDVKVQEVKCIAKGDAYCEFAVKT